MNSILRTIGNTPLVRLQAIEEALDLKGKLYAKLEYFNPFGSIKDRAAYKMILDAEASGLLSSKTVIEATSGNLGISLSAICCVKGYKCIIAMPENMSDTRKKLLKSYGASLILTKSSLGMSGSINKVNSILQNTDAFYCDQFNNPSNIASHIEGTAPEIDIESQGKVDAIISGIGSGGTISGLGRYFKERYRDVQIFGVEPNTFPHKIQGIGAGFTPSILDHSVIDKIFTISYESAQYKSKLLISCSGIFAGVSSGAVLSLGIDLAKQNKYRNKNIVLIFADGGERYI